jgi:hypothetical protein
MTDNVKAWLGWSLFIGCVVGFMAFVYVDSKASVARANAFRAWCVEACARECMVMDDDRYWNQCACDATSSLVGCKP